ncbi:MAG: RhuM family protein, partial [Treponema sp.]|uniref:RhuM family protein n=1 Tax=Treponema sp. TaxID=166 RepID=UPI003FA28AC9
MKDWVEHVDKILAAAGENLLTGSGTVSGQQMENKVETEYKKYSMKTFSQVEKDYLNELKRLEILAQKGGAEKL